MIRYEARGNAIYDQFGNRVCMFDGSMFGAKNAATFARKMNAYPGLETAAKKLAEFRNFPGNSETVLSWGKCNLDNKLTREDVKAACIAVGINHDS